MKWVPRHQNAVRSGSAYQVFAVQHYVTGCPLAKRLVNAVQFSYTIR